jgi:hypothetical protein
MAARHEGAPDPRGAGPEDARLFGPEALPTLRLAAEEIAWLLDRGYAPQAVERLVGDRHQLVERQRIALRRGACSMAQYRQRAARELEPEDVARKTLAIDGFNLIITMEVALSGGPLFTTLDGTVRDLAGLRGSYAPTAVTDEALRRIGAALDALRAKGARFLLDEPVARSGELRGRILEAAKAWKAKATVERVPDADAALRGADLVVSADGAVLDASRSWVNLVGPIVEKVPNAWRIALQ